MALMRENTVAAGSFILPAMHMMTYQNMYFLCTDMSTLGITLGGPSAGPAADPEPDLAMTVTLQ